MWEGTRHVEVRQYFLRDAERTRLIKVVWCPGSGNPAGLFTKNLGGQEFEKRHWNLLQRLCGTPSSGRALQVGNLESHLYLHVGTYM